MAESKTRLGVSAYAICVFIVTLGSNGVRNLLGWWGFLAVAAALTVWGVVLFVRLKPERFRWYRLPSPVYWFLTLAVLSIAWSQYRLESVLGVVAQLATTLLAVVLAFVLTWHEVLRTLGSALRWLIGVSFLFELWVALVVREPVLQPIAEAPESGSVPKLLYWSRDLLFTGGPIQGIVASSVLFGFIGLLGLIVFGIQLRAGLVRPTTGWFWVGAALATILLTRGATVWVALLAAMVALVLALWARRLGPERRVPLYLTGTALVVVAVSLVLFARDFVFGLLGKSADMTGRLETWDAVIALAEQRPWFGWGWVSYWAPWVEPFASLDEKAGVTVMSAHNAWLDVWLQLGIIGVLAFAPIVVLTMWRVWFRAVDPPRRGFGEPLPYATSALWPFLVMVALLVQSLTESRLLIEGNWLLLILLAVKSRFDFQLPSLDAEPTKLPWRRVPIPRHTGPIPVPTARSGR
ncbi:O-antigen ligase family protein [Leucobacter triazinivorans]|uniref:O-antigen ligase family protein n=1 Tax=Leucobacter triazinivorans TaxID=1784719 RepID=A0A4P6KIM9_9MICO|nr:O-antigen ligase family protein [Leucobacter triazinivorans]QBE49434.1 O-antigen ligase family protein [Leucobacter triazinivorans]